MPSHLDYLRKYIQTACSPLTSSISSPSSSMVGGTAKLTSLMTDISDRIAGPYSRIHHNVSKSGITVGT